MGRRYIKAIPSFKAERLTPIPVLEEIEKEDEIWTESRRKKPKLRMRTDDDLSTNSDSGIGPNISEEAQQKVEKPKERSNTPRGFY